MGEIIYMTVIIFYADTKPSEYFEGNNKDTIVIAYFTMKSIHFDKF
jgi:hypothetical protein